MDGYTNMTYTYRLPRVHVQFICHKDIRSKFSVVDMFDGYYRQILPDLSNTSLIHNLKTSVMRDIPPSKWYYNSCNVSSPQVLLTMETEGWAKYDSDWNSTTTTSAAPFRNDGRFQKYIMDKVTPFTLKHYIEDNVCQSMEIYRAYMEDWANLTSESFEDDEYLEHSLILLCGGENYIYYDDEDPGKGFVLIGMLVGIVMVGMIFSELQKFQAPRPSRRTNGTSSSSSTNRSRRSARQRDRPTVEYELTPAEVEMV